MTQFPPKEQTSHSLCAHPGGRIAANKPSLEGTRKLHHQFYTSYIKVPGKVLCNSENFTSGVKPPRYMFWLYCKLLKT